jgi:hypothetical protein
MLPTAPPGTSCQTEFRLVQVKLLTAGLWGASLSVRTAG